ncbi:hypothetical protein VTK73DRAFT_5770 [Phialemonium thermophilum]|uniref:Uncharacterized protein n=1 Tax=Phialemonium thermophilum TaxID=223376 RepID=A0ABR3V0T3_9PEZI
MSSGRAPLRPLPSASRFAPDWIRACGSDLVAFDLDHLDLHVLSAREQVRRVVDALARRQGGDVDEPVHLAPNAVDVHKGAEILEPGDVAVVDLVEHGRVVELLLRWSSEHVVVVGGGEIVSAAPPLLVSVPRGALVVIVLVAVAAFPAAPRARPRPRPRTVSLLPPVSRIRVVPGAAAPLPRRPVLSRLALQVLQHGQRIVDGVRLCPVHPAFLVLHLLVGESQTAEDPLLLFHRAARPRLLFAAALLRLALPLRVQRADQPVDALDQARREVGAHVGQPLPERVQAVAFEPLRDDELGQRLLADAQMVLQLGRDFRHEREQLQRLEIVHSCVGDVELRRMSSCESYAWRKPRAQEVGCSRPPSEK